MANHKYRNKKWLEEKYLIEQLSQSKISKLCKVSHSTIQYWLNKNNIRLRSIGEIAHLRLANHCNLSQEAIEWIDGELLGDGCLTTTAKNKKSESKYCSVLFRYSSKHKEYIDYISNTLNSFGIKQSGNIIKMVDKKTNSIHYKYNSKSYVELIPIYKKWYLSGKKKVPKDIELTPIVLKQWYIGDGSIIQRKKRNIMPYIILCTMGFLAENVIELAKQLTKLGFKASRFSDNTIYISAYSVKDFLEYIGLCPVDCYQYKWLLKEGVL
jgi:hypothetical protein